MQHRIPCLVGQKSDQAAVRHVHYLQGASHILGHPCPYTPPQPSFLHRWFSVPINPPCGTACIQDWGFLEQGELQGRHTGPATTWGKKARQTPVLVPDTTHLTKVWVHVPLPGQSSQSTCSEGSIKLLLSRHHPYLQRSKQGTQTQSLQGTPVFLHTATSPHYR